MSQAPSGGQMSRSTKINYQNWRTEMRGALEIAAKRAGFDVADVAFEQINIDRTWGDRVGERVVCSDESKAKRVAEFCAAWTTRNLPNAYDPQRSTGYVARDSAGRAVHAFGTFYYPCND
jgi:hypothetical protein